MLDSRIQSPSTTPLPVPGASADLVTTVLNDTSTDAMPVLGASTRHYRAYGKRTTNVVNKRASLGEPAWAIESDSDDSDSDDSRPARPATTLAKQRPEKSAPVVVADVVQKQALSKPKQNSKTAATAAAAEQAKENLVVTSARPPAKATNKPDKSALQSPRRRAPLGPKRTVQKQQQLADPHPACHDEPGEPDSSTDSSSPVIAAPKRRTARKRVVVVESASDSSVSFATPPGTPSPVVSDLSFESSSSSIQADSSLSSSTPASLVQEPAKVVFADESAAERVPEKDVDESSSAARDDFATRRRSRRSTAAATTTSSSSSSSTNSTSRRRLPSPSVHPVPTELGPLLPHLLSPTIYNFTSFVSAPLAPLASVSTATRRSASAAWWTKIGEASYSEVFATAAEEEDGGGRGRDEVVVVKVIPIADPRPPRGGGASTTSCTAGEEELPFLSDWSAIQREIVTSRALGGQDTAVPGFVRFKGSVSGAILRTSFRLTWSAHDHPSVCVSVAEHSWCRDRIPKNFLRLGTTTRRNSHPRLTSRSDHVRERSPLP